MAVPVAFRPVLVESQAAQCNGPPEWTERVLANRDAPENVRQTARAFHNYRGNTSAAQRFVHLADGGVADNLGMLSLQVMRAAEPAPSPLTAQEALQARRVLFIVINAEYVRERTYQQNGSDRIGFGEAVLAPIDVAMDVAKRGSVDLWRAQLPAYEAELRRFRCAAAIADCEAIELAMDVITFRDMTLEEYEALFDTPTELSLPREAVDALVAAGRGVVARNAAVAQLRGD
jgi:NTE family protein